MLFLGARGPGILLSLDAGESWAQSSDGFNASDARALSVDPADSSIVLAATSSGGMFRSTDGGTSWEEIARPARVAAIAVHPSDGRTVFIALETGVFRSQDRGATFELRGGNDLRGLSIVDLAIDPRRPDRLYAVAVNNQSIFGPTYFIVRSGDAGDDWNFPGGGQGSFVPLVSIAVDPTDSDRIYVGAQGGFFRSNNRGGDFDDKNNGLRVMAR